MSRPKRILRKKFVVFCEGDTEYNYINGMRTRQGVEIAFVMTEEKRATFWNFWHIAGGKT